MTPRTPSTMRPAGGRRTRWPFASAAATGTDRRFQTVINRQQLEPWLFDH